MCFKLKIKQLRLWCVQVPMPGIPTIIAAAMAIPSKLNAEQLFDYLKVILDGISTRDLKVVAYAADGSAVERSVQSLLDLSSKTRRTFHLKHPRAGKPAIAFVIPFLWRYKATNSNITGFSTWLENISERWVLRCMDVDTRQLRCAIPPISSNLD